jgi:integrase
LGISANKDGLKEAERKCSQLDQELSKDTFNIENWQKKRKLKPHEQPTAELIENFRVEYMRSHKISAETWKQNWMGTFKLLPQNAPLSEVAIVAVVLSKADHSCARQRACQRLQALADFAGIKVDLKPYAGEYGESRLQPRDIPSDELILEYRDLIPNERWQWFYGMLATFGLRPHEVFFCEFLKPHKLLVGDGKTQDRLTYAIPFEGVDLWNLTDVKRPNVTGKTFSDYGRRSQRTFYRYEIPFPLYNLRHRFAIRAAETTDFGVERVSKMMGHSAKIHLQTYQRWITDAMIDDQYEREILNRSNPLKMQP